MERALFFLSVPVLALELSGLPVIDVQLDFNEQRSNIYEANELAELITSPSMQSAVSSAASLFRVA